MTDHQEIYEQHPELFHYTDKTGIAGILTSQSLWATHFRFLNDTTELQLMRAPLAEGFLPIVTESVLKQYREAGIKKRKEMEKAGGALRIARDEAGHLADTFYQVAFEDSESGPALATPFITSFCAHTFDHDYEKENGLLSQWRGYGSGGGYAIVFDTKRLVEMYLAESERYYLSFLQVGDVVYDDDGDAFEKEFGPQIENLKARLPHFSDTGEWGTSEIYTDVLSMFTRLKHRGFREEREVRAVVFPMTRDIKDHITILGSNDVFPNKPLKEIAHRNDGVPYIEMLNPDGKTRLPIKRIIVGPQENQTRMAQEIRPIMGGSRFDIHCSETPILWPQG